MPTLAGGSAARQELIKLSAYAAERSDLVQASGGNTSVKSDDGTMWVKASGCTLADVAAGRGVATVDYASLWRAVDRGDALAEWDRRCTSTGGQGTLRPTMEVSLHGLLGRVVLHTHPLAANAFLCAEGGQAQVDALFGDRADHLYVAYAMPGVELGLALWQVLAAGARVGAPAPHVILLENHGIVIHGDRADEVIDAHERVIGVLTGALGSEAERLRRRPVHATARIPADVRRAVLDAVPQRPALACVLADSDGSRDILFPDAAVFCGPAPIILDDSAQASVEAARRLAAGHLAAWGQAARVWIWRDVALCTGANPGEADAVAEVWWAHATVTRLTQQVGRPRPLPRESVGQLLRSEREAYRREVSARRVERM